ncbi:hypothetical protein BRI6_1568 [plant metagenome]|uniref:Uncharacterized protein n=1 Tax=plant metagenome TaxID=1297885 RepID=A0A484YLY9_9ZZZZ
MRERRSCVAGHLTCAACRRRAVRAGCCNQTLAPRAHSRARPAGSTMTALGPIRIRRGSRNRAGHAEPQYARKTTGNKQTPTTSVSLSPLKR